MRRGGQELRVLSLPHLIPLELHAIKNNRRREGRDLADIAELLRLNPGAVSRDELISLCERFVPPHFERKLPPATVTAPNIDVSFPSWQIADSRPPILSDEAYLEWLTESRKQLLRDGMLEKLRDDPARCPVDTPFILP